MNSFFISTFGRKSSKDSFAVNGQLNFRSANRGFTPSDTRSAFPLVASLKFLTLLRSMQE